MTNFTTNRPPKGRVITTWLLASGPCSRAAAKLIRGGGLRREPLCTRKASQTFDHARQLLTLSGLQAPQRGVLAALG
jgi:hypothetical protein